MVLQNIKILPRVLPSMGQNLNERFDSTILLLLLLALGARSITSLTASSEHMKENYEKSDGTMEILWKSMEIHGKSLDLHGDPWKSI